MNDIVAFLNTRLDEDEAEAQRVEPNLAPRDLRVMVAREGGHPFLVINASRVLADVEARRQIVEMYRGLVEDFTHLDEPVAVYTRRTTLEEVLEHLALPYSDHLDYQESWKP